MTVENADGAPARNVGLLVDSVTFTDAHRMIETLRDTSIISLDLIGVCDSHHLHTYIMHIPDYSQT